MNRFVVLVTALVFLLPGPATDAAGPKTGVCIWQSTPAAVKARMIAAGPTVAAINDTIGAEEGWPVAVACGLPDNQASGQLVYRAMVSNALAESAIQAFERDFGVSRAQLAKAWQAMPVSSREAFGRRGLFDQALPDKAQDDLLAMATALDIKAEEAFELVFAYAWGQSVADYVRDRPLKALLAEY